MKRPVKFLLIAIFILVVLADHKAFGTSFVSFESVRASYRPSEIVVYDSKGRQLMMVRRDFKVRRLQWTELKDISPVFIETLIVSEDKRFYNHSGVDWIAVGSALINNLQGKSRRGASTITMQLSDLLTTDLKYKNRPRELSQKIEQAKMALLLERHWTKEQILEAYVNLVYFKGELQGIASASKILLGKSPDALNAFDSALLVALIRQPSASMEKVAKQVSLLLAKLDRGYTEQQIENFVKRVFSDDRVNTKVPFLPYLTPYLDGDSFKPQQVTIDRDLQYFAMDTLRRNLLSLKKANVNDGAILVVENATGRILAYVGNAGELSSAPFVDAIRARRQAGSTLKPFLYALAIDKGLLNASSLIEDAHISLYTERGIYKPQNYTEDYKGAVTVRQALGSSLNTPAIRALTLLGIEEFYEGLLRFGFGLKEPPDHYGYSLALGAVDVSLYELVRAYRALAQGGVVRPIYLGKLDSKRSKEAVSAESAFIVSDMLSDRSARALSFGFENPLSTRYWSAVKTGTSKDMRDNWCIGFSERYTVGVWVGNFSGSPMWNVSGISGSAQIWLEVMNYLHKRKGSVAPRPPDGVIAKTINIDDNNTKDWFIARYNQYEELSTSKTQFYQRGKIIYPTDGTVIALDPDIPEINQRLFIEVVGDWKDTTLVIDNQTLQIHNGLALWQPREGSHVIYLKDSKERLLDAVTISVRDFRRIVSDQNR